MRSAIQNESQGKTINRGFARSGYLITKSLQVLLFAAMFAGLQFVVWIYQSALRDPRYLDGWILAGGMAFQLGFHIASRTSRVSPTAIKRWRKLHIFAGYLLIAAFLSHSGFSLPDTGFEWALWAGFVAVTLTGIFGTYLAWSLDAKRGIDEGVSYDQVNARRAELREATRTLVAITDPSATSLALPSPPYDVWIRDLYLEHLDAFFSGPRNFAAHIFGSRRPLLELTGEIDSLSRYVDKKNQEKLAAIRDLVVEKDRLDFTGVYLALSRSWLFVHVPVTYGLVTLTLLHVLSVYCFSSGLR